MSHAEMEGGGESHPNFMALWKTDFGIKETEADRLDPVPLMLRGHPTPPAFGRPIERVVVVGRLYKDISKNKETQIELMN